MKAISGTANCVSFPALSVCGRSRSRWWPRRSEQAVLFEPAEAAVVAAEQDPRRSEGQSVWSSPRRGHHRLRPVRGHAGDPPGSDLDQHDAAIGHGDGSHRKAQPFRQHAGRCLVHVCSPMYLHVPVRWDSTDCADRRRARSGDPCHPDHWAITSKRLTSTGFKPV
jgi:hypothetical protein